MKVIYIADDGKEFTDEYECLEYEWKLNHPYLKDICFYDKDHKELDNVTSDDTYNITEKIIVTSEESLKDLRALTEYAGFCAYESIAECGEWNFDYNKGTFVKV